MKISDPKDGLPKETKIKRNTKPQIQAIDINTRKNYGIIQPKKLENNKTKIVITPQKNGIKYTNLAIELTLPIPYESVITHSKLGLKNLQEIVDTTTKAYKHLYENNIKLHKVKYILAPHSYVEKTENKKEETNLKKILRQDLEDYLKIPAQIQNLKEQKYFDVDQYKELVQRKSALHRKLTEYNILTEDGDLK